MIENIRTETLDFAFREAMKKEAIAFAEFMEDYECVLHTDEGVKYWSNSFTDMNKEYTTEQLYDIFNCSVKANNDKNHTTKTD